MNPELERLIDMVVADGQVTDKERAVVIKKAIALDIDPDEAEIYLNGKLHQVNQVKHSSSTASERISDKEGTLTKCPSCGAPAQSFATKCSECGHEFRDIKAEKSITDLFNLLSDIQNSNYDHNNNEERWANIDKQELAISMFPVPNSKEAILEFLAYSLPKAKGHGSKWGNFLNENSTDTQMRKAWKNKFEQVVMKARFSMKDDKKTLEEIENYAKQLGIK
jgi:hypothetical protein